MARTIEYIALTALAVGLASYYAAEVATALSSSLQSSAAMIEGAVR